MTPHRSFTIKKKSSNLKTIPFFSVILPLHPHRVYVRQSLDSIRAQDFQNFEILAVGRSFEAWGKDRAIRRITVLGNDISAARNAGVAASRGRYIAFLDPGDSWKVDFLSRVKSLIRSIDDDPTVGRYS